MRAMLVDIGNSRIKWANLSGPELGDASVESHSGTLPDTVMQIWSEIVPPQRVVCSNVAGDVFANVLNDWCAQQWNIEVEFVRVPPNDCRIEIAYDDAAKFGVDRWLALLAAIRISEATPGMDNVCVIDCGTAVTIDVITRDRVHLGGLIFPGLRLMYSSLVGNTDAIGFDQNSGSDHKSRFLGKNTEEGISKGTLNALAGAIERAYCRIKADLDMPISCFVTGGDAASVIKELKGEYHYQPNLVLAGLHAYITD